MDKKIKKNDIIINIKTNLEHVVDSIDYYNGVTLIFTNDKKYIDINDAIIKSDEFLDIKLVDDLFGSTIEERDMKFLLWQNSLK